MNCYRTMVLVPALPEAGRQQTVGHAAMAKALQEPHHPRLQNAGHGRRQYGNGKSLSLTLPLAQWLV